MFKIAWRNIRKNTAFSATNILGLAIGMAGAILIALWLQNMLTMDRFHEKLDRIYAMSNRDFNGGKDWAWRATPRIMLPTLLSDFPEIETGTRYSTDLTPLVNYKEKRLNTGTAFVDSGFFHMFSFPIVKGQKNKLLTDAKTTVITEKFATKLFGNEDPIGKIIKLDSLDQVTVQAVIKDLPANTTMGFDMLLSWEYAKKIGYFDDNWNNNSTETFILLKPESNLAQFNKKVELITQRHANVGEIIIKNTLKVFASPFSKRFLYDNGEGGDFHSGRIQLVRLFAWIGVFILAVACINYMNLSTAKSEKRAKEVAVRKVVGARRSQLILQFIIESVLISLIALVAAILLVILILPAFNSLVAKNLEISVLSVQTWLYLIAFAVFTGVLAGIYPAFFLSAFTPAKTLKGSLTTGRNKFTMRSALVVLQFVFAIILIISTIVVSKQIQHTKDRERGYNENGLAYTNMVGDIGKNYLNIRNELLASGAVESVSKNLSPITEVYSTSWAFQWPGSTEEDKRISFIRYSSEADAVKTMKMTLVAGRDIDIYTYPTDSTAMLLTETAVKTMRLKNPIGATVKNSFMSFTVVGVVKDFILSSPFDTAEPLVIEGPASYFSTVHYRLNPVHSTEQNLKTIESIFKKFNPEYPFEYRFVDKQYENKFREAQSIGTLSKLFAGLTIFISCLGLLALIAYIAEKRTKEIAVRKVLGAKVSQIASMLSMDFIKLIILALVIASPLAWWMMHAWLNEYSYRIEISWVYFVVAGLAAIIISLLTIGYQAWKAAVANPVVGLKDE